MQTWILLAAVIGSIVVVGIAAVAFVLLRNVRIAQGPAMLGKYPQGNWMSVGLCIGIAIGLIPSFLRIVFDQMASLVPFGPAMGIGLGVALGAALERKYKDELRPLTGEERATRSRLTLLALGVLALLVLSIAVVGAVLFGSP